VTIFEGYIIDWSIVTAILAVLGAAGAAYYSYKSSKKANDIARLRNEATVELERIKLREAWIQNLRHEMSQVGGFSSNATNLSNSENIALTQSQVKMLLLMHPSVEHYQELFQKTQDLVAKNTGGELIDSKFNDIDFINVCQKILKSEWEELNSKFDEYVKKYEEK